MSDTYASTKRNRVYKRKFDHEEMLERRQRDGDTIESLAKRYGVSTARICQLLYPRQGKAAEKRILDHNRSTSHHCASCNAPITVGAAYNARRRGTDPSTCGECRVTASGQKRGLNLARQRGPKTSPTLTSILNELNSVLAGIVDNLRSRA